MRQFGKVDIPQEAFIAALKVDSWAIFELKARTEAKAMEAVQQVWKNGTLT